ncbi:MAG: polyprenyl diphosphate synthase [Corallococcus sp.]|nr:polyprenyl diphosphate synthase [Corallococcus sp.]MCM1359734.1 polyprenyl diphosphate synthase [Corallococcus sp.]MCM1395443.1 polyprenyl diphosphate synthase [Corallococcus sp.]
MNLPQHVALIMDGNGRWAKKRGLLRKAGHEAGLDTAEKIIDFCLFRGIKYLSLYVFSTENWRRPKTEISALFSLAEKYLDGLANFCENRIRIVVSGETEQLPSTLRDKIADIEAKTQNFDAICVNLCINYGGRRDIARAAALVAEQGLPITEENIAANLYNAFMPEPDVIVRTGGQMRLSNFLLFQSAYAELYFTNTLWPDFSSEELDGIISDYCTRSRNFGGLVDRKQ